MISAFNEEDVIGKKLANSLELDYPEKGLEIIVVSDASTDETDNIVKKYSQKYSRIKLIRQEERRGKSIGLNQAAQVAGGEIIVFSDANAIYKKDAVRELVKFYINPEVGFVVGKALYYNGSHPASKQENLYWKYETLLKKLESEFHSLCVGDGAIYAIRRTLYENLDADDISDFTHPLVIASKSFLGVFNPRAVCFEDSAGDFKKEFFRKRRIVNRSWRAFRKRINLFTFNKHYKILFELFSHKILRWFNWLFLSTLYLSNVIIIVLGANQFYQMTLILQIAILILVFVGFIFHRWHKILPGVIFIPYYFWLMHLAAFLGILDDLRGTTYTTWDHVRNA